MPKKNFHFQKLSHVDSCEENISKEESKIRYSLESFRRISKKLKVLLADDRNRISKEAQVWFYNISQKDLTRVFYATLIHQYQAIARKS